MVNLYANPKEDVPTGLRHLPMGVPLAGAAASYIKDLIKHPPQFKIGVLNNNPPIYDLFPKVKGAIERFPAGSGRKISAAAITQTSARGRLRSGSPSRKGARRGKSRSGRAI